MAPRGSAPSTGLARSKLRSAEQTGALPILGQIAAPRVGLDLAVREQSNPSAKYMFADFTDPAPAHWQQAEYPDLYNQIEAYSGCGNLTDGPARIGPVDWTGAF